MKAFARHGAAVLSSDEIVHRLLRDDAAVREDVVAKLERLSDEKTAAVIAYENANKKRATILRAAEQRLAEA